MQGKSFGEMTAAQLVLKKMFLKPKSDIRAVRADNVPNPALLDCFSYLKTAFYLLIMCCVGVFLFQILREIGKLGCYY